MNFTVKVEPIGKDEEKDKLAELFDWIKNDSAATEAMVGMIASCVVFAVLLGFIILLTQI